MVAKRGVSGDPVIKYTSLSCGPRNPCLKANQFPAPGGMIAVSYPETQIKHHLTDTARRCFKLRKKGGMINCKGRGECRGTLMDQVGERVVGFLFIVFFFWFVFWLFFGGGCFLLLKISIQKNLKFNKKADLKDWIS